MQQAKALSQPSIQSQSRQCFELFESLSLLQYERDSSDFSDPTDYRDEFSRFLLWANNIGALLPSGQRNSLDFRLRSVQRVSSRIIEFLADLAEALEDGKYPC